MQIRTEYKFREPEVTCVLTRKVKSKCIRSRLTKLCVECLKQNGVESERKIDKVTGSMLRFTQCKEMDGKLQPIVRSKAKVGRNEKCTCGSLLKAKKCCFK